MSGKVGTAQPSPIAPASVSSYKPSAFYWRQDICAEQATDKLLAFIRDLSSEVRTHQVALAKLGVAPCINEALERAGLADGAGRDDLEETALGLVLELERMKAAIRSFNQIPPKSKMSPSERAAKPHLDPLIP